MLTVSNAVWRISRKGGEHGRVLARSVLESRIRTMPYTVWLEWLFLWQPLIILRGSGSDCQGEISLTRSLGEDGRTNHDA